MRCHKPATVSKRCATSAALPKFAKRLECGGKRSATPLWLFARRRKTRFGGGRWGVQPKRRRAALVAAVHKLCDFGRASVFREALGVRRIPPLFRLTVSLKCQHDAHSLLKELRAEARVACVGPKKGGHWEQR